MHDRVQDVSGHALQPIGQHIFTFTLLPRHAPHALVGFGLHRARPLTLAVQCGLLARQVFDFAWAPSPWVPLIGTVLGALLAWAAGWWGLREVLRRPVMDTLRRAAE